MRKAGGAERAWRRADRCSLDASLCHEARLYHPAHPVQHALRSAPLPQQLPPPRVLHRVAKAASVRCDQVVHPLGLEGASQGLSALGLPAPGPLAIATGVAERRAPRCDPLLGGPLHALGRDAAHPQRPACLPPRLRHSPAAPGLRPGAQPCAAGGHIWEMRLPLGGRPRLGPLSDAPGFLRLEQPGAGSHVLAVRPMVRQPGQPQSGMRSRLAASPCEGGAHR